MVLHSHSTAEDVTQLALLLTEAVDLGRLQRRTLHADPLHDVGKIAVPDRILRKPGTLTDDEYAVIKWQVTYGVAIIHGVLDDAAVLDAVVDHHERRDGQGSRAACHGRGRCSRGA